MIERISLSFEPDLLKNLDRYCREKHYPTRSEAVRDLVRRALVAEAWQKGDKEVVGVVSLVFDHDKRDVNNKLTGQQHKQHDLIISSTHVHLNHHDCLEVILMRGKPAEIKKMADTMLAMPGVKSGGLTMAG